VKASYLPCSIPELQSDCPVLQIHGFAQEVYSNGSLIRIVKRVVHESNRIMVDSGEMGVMLLAHLVISEVFPTL
jgi:hypothetical protein